MKLLVTGSSGLIGSEMVKHVCKLGWEVHGVDKNMRADFFGAGGDTRWNQHRLLPTRKNFHHHEIEIRARPSVAALLPQLKPALLVHAAAHLSCERPFKNEGALSRLGHHQDFGRCVQRNLRGHRQGTLIGV